MILKPGRWVSDRGHCLRCIVNPGRFPYPAGPDRRFAPGNPATWPGRPAHKILLRQYLLPDPTVRFESHLWNQNVMPQVQGHLKNQEPRPQRSKLTWER